MSWFGRYIYNIIIAALMVSILLAITPTKSISASLIRIVVGIFLLMIVIAPATRLQIDDMLNNLSEIDTSSTAIIAEAERYSSARQGQVIKQSVESYIFNIASGLGAEISVEIQLSDDFPCTPDSVRLTGPVSPLVKQRLSVVISQDLGIPEESQTWVLQQTNES